MMLLPQNICIFSNLQQLVPEYGIIKLEKSYHVVVLNEKNCKITHRAYTFKLRHRNASTSSETMHISFVGAMKNCQGTNNFSTKKSETPFFRSRIKTVGINDF